MRTRTSPESLSNGLEAQRPAIVADAAHDLDIHLWSFEEVLMSEAGWWHVNFWVCL
jgi:hypothetical protein